MSKSDAIVAVLITALITAFLTVTVTVAVLSSKDTTTIRLSYPSESPPFRIVPIEKNGVIE